MQFITRSLFVLLVCIFTLNCTTDKTQNEFVKPLNSIPILEVSQEAFGNWNTPGKTLFIRLYETGSVEIEYANEIKEITGNSDNETKERNTLKQVKISEQEFQKFTSLLNSENFQNIQDEYKQKCCCTDAYLNHKIKLNFGGYQKNIFLFGYCDMSDLKNPQARYNPNFPKVLSELMTLVDNTRWKYHPK